MRGRVKEVCLALRLLSSEMESVTQVQILVEVVSFLTNVLEKGMNPSFPSVEQIGFFSLAKGTNIREGKTWKTYTHSGKSISL